MAFTDDERIWPLLVDLASEQFNAMSEAGLPEPCSWGVVPGETLSFDYCGPCKNGKCGMFWVRLVNMFEVESEFGRRACASEFQATIEMGAIRCFQTLDSRGNPPSAAYLADAARVQMAERRVIEQVLRCGHKDNQPFLQGYSPIGPQGGCVGGSWTATYSFL